MEAAAAEPDAAPKPKGITSLSELSAETGATPSQLREYTSEEILELLGELIAR